MSMGPVLVATMVQGGVGERPPEKLHPFFAKPTGGDPSSAPSSDSPGPSSHANAEETNTDDTPGEDGRQPKRRKTETSSGRDNSEPKLASRRRRNGATGATSMDGGIVSHLTKLQPDDALVQSQFPEPVPAVPTPSARDTLTKQHNKGSDAQPQTSQPTPTAALQGPAKKVLKFNPKTGTLGSPPKPKPNKRPTLIVRLQYGRDEGSRKEMGDRIAQILDGNLQIPTTPMKRRAKGGTGSVNALSSQQASTQKTTHPFFSGKTQQGACQNERTEATRSPARRNSVFMSTPVSPRKPRNPFTSSKPTNIPQFGIKSIGTKVPGAMHPLWPPAGMNHVRGLDIKDKITTEIQREEGGPKKFKGHVTDVGTAESVLAHLMNRIDLDSVRRDLPADEDSFMPAPNELRLPERRFESGRKLQARVRKQLARSTLASLVDADGLGRDELANDKQIMLHPAIRRHYLSLETHLSAFDKSTCENVAWTQKYAPAAADEVLQSGKETGLLKQWLVAMKVQAVESGGDMNGDKSKTKADMAPKKKRRKNKLEGFVVDSGDEESDLDDLTECDEDESFVGPALHRRSIVRSGDVSNKDPAKLKNTIVISGPNGCGKTAAVYAVAKELDFEIFEINSSSRRSGKDILERVGDMTRNHLVQQHKAQPAMLGEGSEGSKDKPESGKQGMMTSFFKPKPAATSKQHAKKQSKEKVEESAKSAVPKAQKQSLVLLEEADVLYEEDKQFWATLLGLMSQSKRPFIITCNDESLIPLQSLHLHGVFRFCPPPIRAAVDVCLLIAANEGHCLARPAVESLYQSRGEDLRATITELNYWCQLGVGDRKGGLDWFYPRWPKGSDLDERGEVVRVVSQGTYLHGMGWIVRDMIAATPQKLLAEEEILRQSWDSWHLDMGEWFGTLNMGGPTKALSESDDRSRQRLAALAAYDDMCVALSDADTCSAGAFGTMLQEHVDPTLPALTNAVKDDFIIGRSLLEAEPVAVSTCPHADMALALQSLARQTLYSFLKESSDALELRPVDEKEAISILDVSFCSRRQTLTRMDVAHAFDPIAVSPKAQPTAHLDPSVFDRTMQLITLDVAPWVRGIVAFEHQLMQERLKLSSLLSEGGKRKRMRTTRSAYSALEGGERRLTRKERYFGNSLTTGLVMRTGADSFQSALPVRARESDVEETVTSSPASAGSP
ncbi:hypothetical protein JDV02_003563 [Purpureocillium takamizusanense]|uniref:AAA+ ATPase domain-containing protein n=1 Tax=Purpureocillium takamizusanense TaxID=2060973 RepID=A0A9Q8QCN1_9HYPO|nr:uncharacterized protein JDV02_003563 [Purpureocillium takamizusanense]UNI17190.1 hypothetical protein JDV02_003563 [Purpureocillium takamizusanense]